MNSFFKFWLLIIFILGIKFIQGQYIFKTLNEEKGLTSNQVKCMMKDKDGFIWLGTRNGLSRFDGSEITAFRHDPADSNSLCDNDIRSIYQDSEGLIWIGTRRGISVFSSKNDTFTHYFHEPDDKTSLSKNTIQFITEDVSGKMLIATDANGLDLFDKTNKTFSNWLPSDQVEIQPLRFINTFIGYALDPFDSSIIWFGTQIGILKFNTQTKTFTHFLLEKRNASNPEFFSGKENIIRDILVDQSGMLWLATWGGGLCQFNPSDSKFSIYKFEPLHPINGFRNNIGKLYWKSHDEIWIAAGHRGIANFNILTPEFKFFSDPANGEILSISPSDIITDEKGFLWISSFTQGLFFTNLNAQQFNKISLPYTMTAIATIKTNPELIYTGITGTYGRLAIYNTRTEDFPTFQYSPVSDLAENFFQDMFFGKERLWIVENFDLYWWDEKNSRIRHYDDFNPMAFAVSGASEIPYLLSGCEAPNGEVWIGTKFNGIFRIDPVGKKTVNYYYPDEAAGNIYFQNFIDELYPDSKGRIWYGTTNFGFFDPSTQKFVNLSLPKDFPGAPVKSVVVRVIAESPEGNIWLGTMSHGILIINPNEPRSFIGSYSTQNGLNGNLIFDMTTDNNGYVWAITDKGLSKIIPSTGNVINFGTEYGISNLSKITKSFDGEIFISSNGGIYRFNPDKMEAFKQEIQPYFKSFRIFDKAINLGERPAEQHKIELKPEENFFSIEYGAINFFNPAQTVFSYRLEGMDEQWILAGNRKYVSYTNLPGGNYKFRLRAYDNPDHFTEIALQLFIGTPFWKTIWFYILIAVFVMAFLFGFYQYRMRQVRKQQEIKSKYDKMIGQLEMKALRAQMNPHFLFNSLNSIRYYILKEEFDNASEYLTKFSKLLRLILRNSRQNMITLKEELETLHIYIEFEQMRFSKNFEYIENINSTVNPEDIRLQPMTIQPFIENAIWHGLMPKENNRKLTLSVSLKDKLLTIIIEDNGVGRAKAKSAKQETEMGEVKSYGLQITAERFAILRSVREKRSEFEITDLFDEDNMPAGTRVIINYEI